MRKTHPTQSFEEATGYAPELLAERAARELAHLLRHRRYMARMEEIIQQVTARAERCWRVQARWRTRWTRAGKAGNPAPLLTFFRHWTAAAALRNGVPLPQQVLGTFGMGRLLTPIQKKAHP